MQKLHVNRQMARLKTVFELSVESDARDLQRNWVPPKPSKIFQITFLTSRSKQTLLTCEAYFSELAASSSATHAVAKVVI